MASVLAPVPAVLATATAASEPILSLRAAESSAAPVTPLRPRVGQPVALHMFVSGQRSFQAANIGQLVVRSGDRISSIAIPGVSDNLPPTVTFEQPGPALISMCAAAAASRASNAWEQVTHCTRVIVNVEPDGHGLPPIIQDPGVNQKLGTRIELLPLMQTFRMHVGDLLPVKGYWKGHSAAGATVTAYRPDGTTITETSAPWGVANFVMDQAGIWMLQMTKIDGDVTHVAELMFEISRETPR